MSEVNPDRPTGVATLPRYLRKGLAKQDVETLRIVQQSVDELLEEKERPVEADELPQTAGLVASSQLQIIDLTGTGIRWGKDGR
ncbi:hypothetical protein [Halosimplex sp. TS25]|uniref:hypothetical protein n=1 Tax=Halosimplex rarum TaxID=3396619 RepID=UPI0039E7C24C